MGNEGVYHHLGEELLAYIRPRVGADDAEDLFQDMWVRMLAHPPKAGNLRAWLYAVVRNLIADYHRQRRFEVSGDLPDLVAEDRGEVSEMESQVASWLRPMIEKLPEHYATPLLLADFHGLAMKEIAARLCALRFGCEIKGSTGSGDAGT